MSTLLSPCKVNPRANVYFDGKCVSHSLEMADGSKKSVGVIMPAELSFSTQSPETMETIAGSCEVQIANASTWTRYNVGQSFKVPGNSSFKIRVSTEPYHYVCHVE